MSGSYSAVPPPGEAAAPVDFNALIQMAKERAAQVAAGKPMAPPPVVPVASDSSGMLKRPREDDGGAYFSVGEPDAKRTSTPSWSGTGANSSHVGLGAGQTETMDIPDKAVGFVIGKGGENIKRITSSTNARVQINPDSYDGQTRKVTLSGDPRAVTMAREMIDDILREFQQNDQSKSQGFMAAGQGPRVEMMCPAGKVGLIIGKGGEKIRELMQRTGTHIKVVQDQSTMGAPSKPVIITGDTQSQVDEARRLIEEIVDLPDDGPGGGHHHGGSGARDQIVVPHGLVGLIIGTGGSTIKALQQRTGARIQLLPDNGAPDRYVSLEGSAEAIQAAKKEIEDMMEDNRHRVGGGGRPQRTEMERIPCVATKVGLVIGKGGETIKQLQSEIGCKIHLDREAPPGPNKFFIVEGSPDQIERARQRIWELSGGGPPTAGMPGGYGFPPMPMPGWGAPAGAWGAPAWGGGYSAVPAAPWGQAPVAQAGYGYAAPQAAVNAGGYSAPASSAGYAAPSQAADQQASAQQYQQQYAQPSTQQPGATQEQPELTEQQKIWAKQWEEYNARMAAAAQSGSAPQQQQ